MPGALSAEARAPPVERPVQQQQSASACGVGAAGERGISLPGQSAQQHIWLEDESDESGDKARELRPAAGAGSRVIISRPITANAQTLTTAGCRLARQAITPRREPMRHLLCRGRWDTGFALETDCYHRADKKSTPSCCIFSHKLWLPGRPAGAASRRSTRLTPDSSSRHCALSDASCLGAGRRR